MANWNFRRSVSIGGVRLNFSKSGVGYSVGGPWYRVGRTAGGQTYRTVRVPGTGLYKREYGPRGPNGGNAASSSAAARKLTVHVTGAFVALLFGIAGFGTGYWLLSLILVLIAVGLIVRVILSVTTVMNRNSDENTKHAASEELEKGEPEAAIAHLEPLIGKSEDPEIPVLAGLAYERAGRGEEAEAAFEAGHRKAGNMATLCLYADQVRHNGRPQEAVKLLQGKPPEEPKKAALYFAVLAQCFLDLGDPQAVLDAAERGPVAAKETDHDQLCLSYVHASALEALGRWKEALAGFEKVRSVAIDFEDVKERIERLSKK